MHGYQAENEDGSIEQEMSSVSEIRSWFEVPAIAHYCYLFRAAFDLTEFEIEVRHCFAFSN